MLLGLNDDLCLYVSVDIYLVTGSGSFLLFFFKDVTDSTVHLHELLRVITIFHTMNIAAYVCSFVFRFVLIVLVALIVSLSSKTFDFKVWVSSSSTFILSLSSCPLTKCTYAHQTCKIVVWKILGFLLLQRLISPQAAPASHFDINMILLALSLKLTISVLMMLENNIFTYSTL